MTSTEPPRTQTRSSERFDITCPVIYGGAPFVGEGSLVNLSLSGCSVSSNRTVLAGGYIRLNVILPDQHHSLRIELAKVRWVRNHTFGIEFIRLPIISDQPLDRAHWERFIRSLPRQAAP